mmetsp:Transcript_26926/g.67064  ORF Transcript_26926/g.67064 Transcript_26926/m.67064 type:complete len:340 (+) Transcript_26926:359-1378(+)
MLLVVGPSCPWLHGPPWGLQRWLLLMLLLVLLQGGCCRQWEGRMQADRPSCLHLLREGRAVEGGCRQCRCAGRCGSGRHRTPPAQHHQHHRHWHPPPCHGLSTRRCQARPPTRHLDGPPLPAVAAPARPLRCPVLRRPPPDPPLLPWALRRPPSSSAAADAHHSVAWLRWHRQASHPLHRMPCRAGRPSPAACPPGACSPPGRTTAGPHSCSPPLPHACAPQVRQRTDRARSDCLRWGGGSRSCREGRYGRCGARRRCQCLAVRPAPLRGVPSVPAGRGCGGGRGGRCPWPEGRPVPCRCNGRRVWPGSMAGRQGVMRGSPRAGPCGGVDLGTSCLGTP